MRWGVSCTKSGMKSAPNSTRPRRQPWPILSVSTLQTKNPPLKICVSEKEFAFSSPVLAATNTPTSQLRLCHSGDAACPFAAPAISSKALIRRMFLRREMGFLRVALIGVSHRPRVIPERVPCFPRRSERLRSTQAASREKSRCNGVLPKINLVRIARRAIPGSLSVQNIRSTADGIERATRGVNREQVAGVAFQPSREVLVQEIFP